MQKVNRRDNKPIMYDAASTIDKICTVGDSIERSNHALRDAWPEFILLKKSKSNGSRTSSPFRAYKLSQMKVHHGAGFVIAMGNSAQRTGCGHHRAVMEMTPAIGNNDGNQFVHPKTFGRLLLSRRLPSNHTHLQYNLCLANPFRFVLADVDKAIVLRSSLFNGQETIVYTNWH